MKTLIVYATRYGCTEKGAQKLASLLAGPTDLVDLNKDPVPDPAGYDTVVIGSSIYVGQVQNAVQVFCESHMQTLLNKRLGLYICAANVEQADAQLSQNFPVVLRDHAVATGHFGYAIQMKKMNFVERTAIKMIMKTRESSENLMDDHIALFAAIMEGRDARAARA